MSTTDIIEKKMNDTKVNNFFQSKYEKQITIKKYSLMKYTRQTEILG